MMRKTALVALLMLFLPASAVRSGDGEVRLLTDETIPLYLARGRELAKNSQWATMIDVLQRIVVGDPGVFPDLNPEVLNAAVYSDDGKLFYPARELCLKELAAMPPEGLRAYRGIYDPKARQLFKQAGDEPGLEGRLQKYTRVFDDYLVSSVGDDALEQAAQINLDLGRYYEALALFRRLIDVYPKDTDRDLAMVLTKAAFCAARIGDREHRDVLLERLASEYPSSRIRLLGKQVTTAEIAAHPALKVAGNARHVHRDDWPLPGGNAARSRAADDLPEDLPRKPLWSFKLSERDARLDCTYDHQWRVVVHDREAAQPPAGQVHSELCAPFPTVRPVLYDGLVLYKDCLELVARRVGSGTFELLRGRYVQPADAAMDDPGFLFPVAEVRPGHRGQPNLIRGAEDVHRFLDYGENGVVAALGRIFVIENTQVRSHLRGPNQVPKPGRSNLLTSYDRASGKLLWAWQAQLCAREVHDNATLREEWNSDFQDHPNPVFRGPGVAAGTMLYTLAHESDGLDGISLWAFDLRQGRVRFRTLIHRQDEVPQRLPVGASIAVAGGVVYVVTSSGVLAAIDALPPGRVRWISRYPRTYVQSKGNRGRRGPARIDMSFAYNDPIVTAGKVIVAAPDSPDLLAFDAETGKIAWRQRHGAGAPLGKVSHIVGAAGGLVVLAGSDVTAVKVATGEIAWGPVGLLRAFAYGRGFVGGKYVYVPTTQPSDNRAAIHRYELQTGTEAAPLRFDVAKLGNLLAVDGRLIAANDDEVMCFSTAARELESLDRRIRQDGETGALLLERAQIGLRGRLGDARAREDFRRALAAALKRGENPRGIRQRALAHLLAMAGAGKSLEPLTEAREILKQAAADPSQRLRAYEAQVALLEARILGASGEEERSLAALESFLDGHADTEVIVDAKVMKAAVAAKQVRAKLIFTNQAFQDAFVKSIRSRIEDAFAKGDADALRDIPRRYDNASPTEEALFALARLYENKGETVSAEGILRDLIDRFKNHEASVEAQLRLARILLGKGFVADARTERNRAVSRMTAAQRETLAALLDEIDKKLPAVGQPTIVPRLKLPLSRKPLEGGDAATVVAMHGDTNALREDLVLLAGAAGYTAIDGEGKVLWQAPNPAGPGIEFGPEQTPETVVVAAAIAAGRFAEVVGDDIVIGDIFGLSRIDAKTGRLLWQRPKLQADAAKDAKSAIVALRGDVVALRERDTVNRRRQVPAYAIAGGVVVSVHPVRGVEAFGLNTGELLWQDTEVRGATIGSPGIVGQLLAVGWADPGRVRVYGLTDGRFYSEYLAPVDPKTKEPGTLLAPPVLDPLGRLLVVSGKGALQPEGRLEVMHARDGSPAQARSYPAHGRYARVLHADGKLVVFHDGGSGGMNLHFIDLVNDREVIRAGSDLVREVHVLRDGGRLFTFTHTLGVGDVGARLFRIDLETRDVLEYELPPAEHAYARPVLTRHHVVIAAAGAGSARVRLYDREASRDTRQAKRVFRLGAGGLADEIEIRSAGQVHYSVAPSVAVTTGGLALSTPFGNLRLAGDEPR